MYTLICKYCNKPFERNRKEYQYCCQRCAYDDRIGKPRHPNAGRKKTKKPTQFVCEYCNNKFERMVKPSLEAKCTFQFCSPSCRNKARKLKKIPCPICGKQFKPNVIDTGGARKKYCSQECAWKAQVGVPSVKATPQEIKDAVRKIYPSQGPEPIMKKFGLSIGSVRQIASKQNIKLDPDVYYNRVHRAAQEYMSTQNNPNWQGGITYQKWGDNWLEQRQKTLERDNYTCQVCFRFGNVVHHIIPRRYFDEDINKANELSNLITLCDKHHVPVEVGKIPCPKPRAS